MSNEADKAARQLRVEVEGNGPALILLDDIRAVLDDRERLIGELREAQKKLAAQQQSVIWVQKRRDVDRSDTHARLDELGRELNRIVRQQVDDSNDHEERLLRLERLHGLQQ